MFVCVCVCQREKRDREREELKAGLTDGTKAQGVDSAVKPREGLTAIAAEATSARGKRR